MAAARSRAAGGDQRVDLVAAARQSRKPPRAASIEADLFRIAMREIDGWGCFALAAAGKIGSKRCTDIAEVCPMIFPPILRKILQSMGPAVPRPAVKDAVLGGVGVMFGLGLTGLFALSPLTDLDTGLFLIAPFAATSALLFVLPNSPLAQPWSAIVGNTLAAVVGIAVCMVVADPLLRLVLSVGLTLSVTMLARAMHPAAAAVAMTIALNPQIVEALGFWFAIFPVALGTSALVGLAMVYARLTGRRYPFRQFGAAGPQKTRDAAPVERMGLSEGALIEILERYRQSFNLGVQDLARLVGAVQLQAAAQAQPRVAQDIMSVDLVTVAPDARRTDIAEIFLEHGFTSLPVVDAAGAYVGIIFQLGLVEQADRAAQARDLIAKAVPRITAQTPLSVVLPLLAQGRTDALPVIKGDRIIGIVTQTDLIASLARSALARA